MSWLSSVFSFTNFARPVCFAAIFSTTGANARHGPHHGAQKSTSTGKSLLRTSASNVFSETSGNELMVWNTSAP